MNSSSALLAVSGADARGDSSASLAAWESPAGAAPAAGAMREVERRLSPALRHAEAAAAALATLLPAANAAAAADAAGSADAAAGGAGGGAGGEAAAAPGERSPGGGCAGRVLALAGALAELQARLAAQAAALAGTPAPFSSSPNLTPVCPEPAGALYTPPRAALGREAAGGGKGGAAEDSETAMSQEATPPQQRGGAEAAADGADAAGAAGAADAARRRALLARIEQLEASLQGPAACEPLALGAAPAEGQGGWLVTSPAAGDVGGLGGAGAGGARAALARVARVGVREARNVAAGGKRHTEYVVEVVLAARPGGGAEGGGAGGEAFCFARRYSEFRALYEALAAGGAAEMPPVAAQLFRSPAAQARAHPLHHHPALPPSGGRPPRPDTRL